MIVLAWASGFTIWVGLGALVAPHEFVPVLLGVVACVVATRAAYTQAQKLRARLRALALEAARRSGKGARDLEDVLEEAGYGEFQVWLLTTGTFIACVAATTFIILGMFLFVKTGNLGTTIMSSLMLLASTAAIVRSQKTDSAAAQNSLLTSKYSQRLGAATNAAAAVDKEYVDPLHVLVPPSVTAEDCEKEGGESKGGKDGEEAAAGGGAEAV
uniref:Uncharacterized protein n=2 Tax=Heterosigma akashiwo TaxID=2829 RepID=A0A6T5NI53_HETAK